MSERDNYQPEQPSPYEPSPARLNWNRNVEGEEQHVNALAISTAVKDIIIATHYEQRTGKHQRYYTDDLDNDRMIETVMDDEFKKMVLFGCGFERRRLEKQGIVFDFRAMQGGGEQQ